MRRPDEFVADLGRSFLRFMPQRSGFRLRRISASLAVVASLLDRVLLTGACQYLCGCLGLVACAERLPIQRWYLRPTDVIVVHEGLLHVPPRRDRKSAYVADLIYGANIILDIEKQLSSCLRRKCATRGMGRPQSLAGRGTVQDDSRGNSFFSERTRSKPDGGRYRS
jgi:hypothetical protein